MANAIIEDGEIYLGSNKYKIIGGIRPNYFSAFPQKLITGDYDYANQQLLSAWITNDQRGGIGIEEMDESVHGDRCWWSELILGYRRHLPLPRLATKITTLPVSISPVIPNADMETSSGWSVGIQSMTQVHGGTYSWRVTGTNTATDDDNGFANSWRGRKFTFTCWTWASTGGTSIELNDGIGTSTSSAHTGNSSWQQLSVTRILSTTATRLRYQLKNTAGGQFAYFDDAAISAQNGIGTAFYFANFNGSLYMAMGKILNKLNSARDTFDSIYEFDTVIADIKIGPKNSLYIFLGDTSTYWFMDTSQAFTETDVTGATLGISWDSKLFIMDSEGAFKYSATPNVSSPSYTPAGDITDIKDGDINRLFIGRDADGNDIIYAGTTGPLQAYDFANTIWTGTSVKLPDHPNGGMGALTWTDAIYVSFGLDVLKYVPGRTAIVSPMGLSRDDSIPEEYNGEILYFTEGDNFMFALVGASPTSGSSKSSVMAWDGVGWEHTWSPPTTLIDDCEDDWVEGANTTSSVDSSDFQVGSGSLKLEVAAGAGAGEDLATETISSLDISQHNSISLRVKSSVALDASDMTLDLDDAGGEEESINFPAIVADTWTKVVLTIADPASNTAITSVTIRQEVDKGAFTLHIDQIEAQTYNGSMTSAIVSSAQSAYALYFDHDSEVYYVDLYRGIRNPHKLPGTFTYATDGIHITPWFDANTAVESKTAKRFQLFCKGMSSNETVKVFYRIDHSETDRDTGWTSLGTISSDGKTTFTFGSSGIGVAFQDIQFRFDLTRGSTNTNTPIIQATVLEYLKLTKKLWGWSFTIDASEDHDGQTPKEQWASLKTIVESTTLVEFTYRAELDGTETKYVFSHPFAGLIQTGEEFKAQYTLSVVEP